MSKELIFEEFEKEHCVKCGNCCRSFEKFQITKRELKQIAQHLNITWQELLKRLHTRLIGDKCYIKQPCIFLKDNICTIYEIRPWNCRAFPMYAIAEDNSKLLQDIDCAVVRALREEWRKYTK